MSLGPVQRGDAQSATPSESGAGSRARRRSSPPRGSGSPRREFLHVDDMAAASLFVLNLPKRIYDKNTEPMLTHINVGTGIDVTIRELAETIKEVVGFDGAILFDQSKPDGTMRKLMDNSKLRNMGWSPRIQLEEGLRRTYDWFLRTGSHIRT